MFFLFECLIKDMKYILLFVCFIGTRFFIKYILLGLSTMGFEKEIEKRDEHIHFRLKGDFTGFEIDKELIDVFYKIEESVTRYNCFKVLIDATELDYKIRTNERYKIGEFIANLYRKNFIKIACLRCSDKKDDFTEIVATNRGAVFKFFIDEKEAINWLKD